MNSRFRLFHEALGRISRTSPDCKRRLYTDTIYPYPHNHIGSKVYPTRYFYRENWKTNEKDAFENKEVWLFSRAFWAYIWYNIFAHPEAFMGHFPGDIDPTKWTDEELGIPPLEEGSYYEWYEKNRIDDNPHQK